MKIFTNKGLFRKLLIAIIVIMLFSTVVPTKVAYANDDAASKVGGALLSPIASLMIGFGDVLMNIIHKTVYDMDSSYMLITRNSDAWGIVWTIIAAIAAIVLTAVVIYVTAGAGIALLKALGVAATIGASTIGTIVTVSLGAGVLAGSLTALDWFGDNVVFPMYQVSPEEIFKGDIPLLDVNFFNPNNQEETSTKVVNGDTIETINFDWNVAKNAGWTTGSGDIENTISMETFKEKFPDETIWHQVTINEGQTNYYLCGSKYNLLEPEYDALGDYAAIVQEKGGVVKQQFEALMEELGFTSTLITNDYNIRIDYSDSSIESSPVVIYIEEDDNTHYIISKPNIHKITIMDVNNNTVASYKNEWVIKEDYEAEEKEYARNTSIQKCKIETETTVIKSTAGQLQGTVASWYFTIRNFVLVIMMLILLYIGIRIMLCGIASEKAKYKNMLMDWLVAICLVFIMHYIMVFAMNLVDGITNIFATVGNGDDPYANIYEIDADMEKKLKNELSDKGQDIDQFIVKEGDNVVTNEAGNKYFMWDAKNIVGMARIQAALCESGTITYIGYGIIFLVLVFYTIFFLYTYLKRTLYLTFFTIIAPLVAMTYPIDKLHDGKAQAFNMWFKEYIFNLAIQPVHLLLYTVLISSAFELSSSNMIYTLVAIGFMMPAEKFIRKMFGFDKAQTPGFLSGAAGTALMVTGFNKLFHRKPHNSGKFIEDKENAGKEDKINMKDDSAVDPFLLAQTSNAQESSNMSNVLSNQEKARQQQIAKEEMEKARLAAQTTNTSAKSYINRDGNIGFDRAGNFKKQYDDTELKRSVEQLKKSRENQEQGQKKDGFWRRQGRGIKAASKAYARQKLKRFGNNLATGKTIRNIAKTTGGLYLGATGALLGGTFGLVSGDAKNVWQYGATLGAAGYALGARDIKAHPDVEMAYAEYERGQYGSEEEYRKHLLEEQRKAVAGNDKKLEELRTYLKLDDVKEARGYMEEYGDCIDAGITDMEDFATIIKAVEEKQWNREMAITAAKYYKKAGGKPKNMGKRDRENIEYQYRNIVKANGITDEKEVDETVKIMLKNLDTYGSIKDNLTQL